MGLVLTVTVESPVMGIQKELLRILAPQRGSASSSTRDVSSSEGSSPTNASPIALKSRSRNASLVLPVYSPLPASLHVVRNHDNKASSPSDLNHLVVDLDDRATSPDYPGDDHAGNNVRQNLLPTVTPTLRPVASSLETMRDEENNNIRLANDDTQHEDSL